MKEYRDQRLGFIDALRGLAILLVILVHIKGIMPDVSSLSNAVLSFGRMGVQLFFLASAYTLCFSWLGKKGNGLHNEVQSFFVRTYFRIAPLYYVGIAVYCAAVVIISTRTAPFVWPEQYSIRSILANVFLLHGFYPAGNNNVVPGGWSIGTEVAFYLAFPWLFEWIYKRAALASRLVAIPILYCVFTTTVGMLAEWIFSFKIRMGDYWFHSIFNQLTVFIVGISGMLYHERYLRRFSVEWDIAFLALFVYVSFLLWNVEQNWAMTILPLAVGFAFLSLRILLHGSTIAASSCLGALVKSLIQCTSGISLLLRSLSNWYLYRCYLLRISAWLLCLRLLSQLLFPWRLLVNVTLKSLVFDLGKPLLIFSLEQSPGPL